MERASAAPFNMAAYAIGRAARATPGKQALVVLGGTDAPPLETWTFAELEDAVLRVAGGLREAGLAPGDRLMIRLDNTSSYAILFFGAIAAGIVALPVSSQLTDAEAEFLLADSGAVAVATARSGPWTDRLAAGRVLSAADVTMLQRSGPRADYAATDAEGPAFLIYTSGTTAAPKGVLHAQRSALGRVPMYRGWYGIGAQDRMLHAGAFNWTFTLGTGLTDPWANGATAIVHVGEKDPALWPALICASGATLFAAVPGVIRQLLKYGDIGGASLTTLRHVLVAGETPSPGLLDDWTARTGKPIYEALGMSEVSTYISSGPDTPRRAGFVGRPQPGRRVAILPADSAGETPLAAGAEGLIAVHRSDPGLMLGYWRRPDEERAVMRGDWFVGGDLGVMGEDGYIAHTGRANDLMKALGYRVSPLEVEAALATHPSVAEVACAEIRVREDVSIIGAFIVLREGTTADAHAIKQHAASRLAAYKCPREVYFVPALPRTPNGKVKRSALATVA